MQSFQVILLCASWCDSCRRFFDELKAHQRLMPSFTYLWVDIEDQADVIDPIEVENFPTLLLEQGRQILFYGTIRPSIDHLNSLIDHAATRPIIDGSIHQELLPLVDRIYAWQQIASS